MTHNTFAAQQSAIVQLHPPLELPAVEASHYPQEGPLSNVTKTLKAGVQATLGRMGLRLIPRERDSATLLDALAQMKFRSVIDVGANRGNTLALWRKLFPAAHIYAFEPVPSSYAALVQSISGENNVTTYNMAAGSESGAVSMQIHIDHDSSSSILPSTKLSHELIPVTRRSETRLVEQTRLDDVLIGGSVTLSDPIFMKLDVQGYERQVLDGAPVLLSRCRAVLTEVGIPILYEGQSSFDDIHRRLTAAGLSFFGFYEQFHAPDNQPVYADVVYARQSI